MSDYLRPRKLDARIEALLEEWSPQYLTPSEISLLVGSRTTGRHVADSLRRLLSADRIRIDQTSRPLTRKAVLLETDARLYWNDEKAVR